MIPCNKHFVYVLSGPHFQFVRKHFATDIISMSEANIDPRRIFELSWAVFELLRVLNGCWNDFELELTWIQLVVDLRLMFLTPCHTEQR